MIALKERASRVGFGMEPEAFEDRHRDEPDREGGDEPEHRHPAKQGVPLPPGTRRETAGREEENRERDLEKAAQRPENPRDERSGDVPRGKRAERDGGDPGHEDDRRGEGERERREVEDEEGPPQSAASPANSTETGGTKPAAAARARKSSTACLPRSPYPRVQSLTYIATKRSARPRSRSRANRIA